MFDLRWLLVIAITCVGLVSAAISPAHAATITLNKTDYVPGETVYVDGSGWAAGETVTLVFSENDQTACGPFTFYAIADGDGNIHNEEFAPHAHHVGKTLTLTATGGTSGLTVSVVFTDAAANLDQGKNEKASAPVNPVQWVNGNLNDNQSHYIETMSIPYRMVMTGLTLGSHTLVIGWDTKDNNLAAIDYLTHYQRLEPHSQFLPVHTAETVNPLLGLGGTFSAPTTFAIPVPGNAGTPLGTMPVSSFNALPGAERELTIYNGTITNAVYNAQDPLNIAHAQSEMTITFTASASTVVIAWGGHIAGNGPAEWNGLALPGGSPYHMRLIALDGSGGNQDRSLKAGAVFQCEVEGPSPVCPATTNQYCVQHNISGSVTIAWSFTANTSGASFVGPTNGACVDVASGTGGSYTLKASVLGADGGVICEHSFTVNSAPVCSLTGPDGPACPGTTQQFCGPANAGSYQWTVQGNGQIDGPANGQCVNVTAGAGCNASYTVSLQIADALGCSSTCQKIINVQDTSAPTLVGVPTGGDLGCNPVLPACANVTATDNCDSSPTVSCTPGAITGAGCAKQQTFTYSAVDDCGNSAVATATYTWKEDTAAPVLAGVPAGGDLGCNPALPSCGNVTANDVCDGPVNVTCTPGAIEGAGCNKSQTFSYSAVDACGNSASASATWTWKEDTTAPVLVGVPSGGDLGCNPTLPSCDNGVTANDVCDGPVNVTCTPGAIEGAGCNKSQTFSYSAVDACGNSASQSATYTWKEDTAAPVLAGVPAGGDLGCNPALPSCGNVTANDVCDGPVNVTCTPGAIEGAGCNKSQTFSYSAVDACGNSTSASATWTWKEDTAAPVLAGVPSGGDLGCNPALPSCGDVTASDVCDGPVNVTCTPGTIEGEGCFKSQTFSYSATDACGNSASASATWTWKEDTTAPVLAGVPTGGDLGCNPALPACDNSVSANDVCDGPVNVTCTPGPIDNGKGPCAKRQTFTYSAVDACGNSASETATYFWTEDTQNPVLVGLPTGGDLGCNPATLPACDPAVAATDNCGDLPATCVPGDITGDGCLKSQSFTYSAVDFCGNSASATVNYTWKEDITPPVLAGVPAGGDLGCNPALPICDNGVSASDLCDGSVQVICTPGEILIGRDGCRKKQTFTYSAVDACGNSASETATYTWSEDTQNPVLVGVPTGGDLGCNPATLPACDPAVAATDNCGDLAATCVPGDITGDGCLKSQTFTYSAVDFCGNSASATVVYSWKEDTAPPVFAGLPEGDDLGCNPELPVCGDVTASDVCDGPVNVTCTPGEILGEDCFKSQTFTYSAVDACGNSASESVTWTWKEDHERPRFVNLPGGGDLGCNPATLPTCSNTVIASDNCDSPGQVNVFCQPGPIQSFGTCGKRQTFTYIAIDRCGNRETRPVTYTWTEDLTPPVLSGVPAGGDLGCNPALPACGDVSANDACDGAVDVDCTPGDITGEGCFKSQTFTYSAVDHCGNTATSSATWTWKEDLTGPDLICPPNRQLECGEPTIPAHTGEGTATDLCGTATVEHFDSPIPPNCTGQPGIARLWVATDECGNTSTCVQTIEFVDTTPPEVECPPDVTVECNTPYDPSVTGSPTSHDNCGGEILVDFDDAGLTPPDVNCAGTPIQRTWTFTDACGNSATCVQIISFQDTGAPTVTCPGDIAVGECDNTVTFTASGSDDCDESVDVVCVPPSGSVFDVGTTPVTCTATDDCGNTGSCTFNVTVDPSPVCSITGNNGPICSNQTLQLCAPEGDYTYLWNNGSTERCITVGPGVYSVTITDPKTGCSSVCTTTIGTRSCHENCPRTVGFWQAQCSLDTDPASRFSSANLLAIVQCVDAKSTFFSFSGNAVGKYCAIVNPSKTDQRVQAKRQYAAFLSNICAGELGLTPANGDQIFIDLNTPISCTGLGSTTLGALVAEVDGLLATLEGQNLKNNAVKQAYSAIVSCLDKINNGKIPDSFCPSGMPAMTYAGDVMYSMDETTETSDLQPGTGEEVAPGIELYRPSPNPFTGITRIAYAVSGTGGHVEIGIFDLAGRRVRTLVSGFQSPGRYELQWNGQSDNGSFAHHGVYFVRSNVAGEMKSMSVVYVK